MPAETILILGGTAEANRLSRDIAERWPEKRLILSLAGRTATPVLPACAVRIGGFGGVRGLAAFLTNEGVEAVLDATHPFAAQISSNAAKAAEDAGVPRLALLRPPWERKSGDRWQDVEDVAGARDALPPGARPFLALGRQHVAPFAARRDLSIVLRMIDPPADPLPFSCELVLAKPSPEAEAEARLFETLKVTHLVSRNSGGERSYAKIAAARALGLPVIMIARPPAPPAPIVQDVESVLLWLAGL